MPQQTVRGWLFRTSGPLAGTRYLLRGPVTRVGRSPDNDIVLEGEEAATVSAHHAEIRREGLAYRLYDLGSTNGTYVNGQAVTNATLEQTVSIRLGAHGPELGFVLEAGAGADLDQTLVISPADIVSQPPTAAASAPIDQEHEKLLASAIAQARRARRAGIGDQTLILMRDALRTALHRSSRKLRRVIALLAIALVAIVAYAGWQITSLRREKYRIDRRIQELEARLQQPGQDSRSMEQLIDELNQYQNQARALQRNALYRWGVHEQQDFVVREIQALMAEFGAEAYSVPPEFVEQVKVFIKRYQGPDFPHMERALTETRKELQTIRQVLRQEQLPPDLGYIVLAESAFLNTEESPAGAAGLWQFTPATARAYGLRVSKGVDERLNVRKSTQAACRFIRELILDFGAGSSVMLALAAYNLGPGKVKQAVRRVVHNPVKERDFWYLYRVRALPAETRSYVPKVIAAMIIGRNPQHFGFWLLASGF